MWQEGRQHLGLYKCGQNSCIHMYVGVSVWHTSVWWNCNERPLKFIYQPEYEIKFSQTFNFSYCLRHWKVTLSFCWQHTQIHHKLSKTFCLTQIHTYFFHIICVCVCVFNCVLYLLDGRIVLLALIWLTALNCCSSHGCFGTAFVFLLTRMRAITFREE